MTLQQPLSDAQRLALQVLNVSAAIYQLGSGVLEFLEGHLLAAAWNGLGVVACTVVFWYQRRIRLGVEGWALPLVVVWWVMHAVKTLPHVNILHVLLNTQLLVVVLAFTMLPQRWAIWSSVVSYVVVVGSLLLLQVMNWQLVLDQAFLCSLVGGLAVAGHQVGAAQSSAAHYFDLALRDPLTGLPNRRIAGIAFEAWRQEGQPLALEEAAVLLLDLDHFKRVNDEYGHATGDLALQVVAQTLSQHIQGEDFVCRWGGEEFLIMFRRMEPGSALRRATEVIRAVEAISHPQLPPLTVSAGLAMLSEFTDERQFMALVDQRLYAAKEAGRNTVVMR